jgi:hypothetical protein
MWYEAVYLLMLGDSLAPVPVIHLILSRNARVGPKSGQQITVTGETYFTYNLHFA